MMSPSEQQDIGSSSSTSTSTPKISASGTNAAATTMTAMEEEDQLVSPIQRKQSMTTPCGIPAPPPPSPALGAISSSPGTYSPSFYRNILQASPYPPSHQQYVVAQSHHRLHQSAPNLSYSPYTNNASSSNIPPAISTGSTVGTGTVPFMPNLVLHPHNHTSATIATTTTSMTPASFASSSDHIVKSVMEQVMQEERLRRIQKEKEELGITDILELRHLLREERIRSARFAAELAVQKATAAASQLESEVSEEGRINCVLRQLDTVHQEKGRIIVELEREEEMLTNTLQKKLAKVKREKELLQQQIQVEQTSHAELKNKLDNMELSHNQDMIEEEEEDEEQEDEVDDSMLPDLAGQAAAREEAATNHNNIMDED